MSILTNFQSEFTYMYNNFKRAITIKEILRTYDSRSDLTPTEDSTTSTYAMVRGIDELIDYTKYGDIQDASLIALLDPSETISKEDEIVIDSITYEIMEITTVDCAGTDVYIEVLLKKSD